jgi:hypothetical protein
MISTISLKYSVSSCAMASGRIDSAIDVNPRISLNRIVIGRRSPPSGTTVSCCAISAAMFGAKYRSKFDRTIASRLTCSA